MLFGLKNSPETFQRTIDGIISPWKWQYALIYINEIFVFSRSKNEHIVQVCQVFDLLRDTELALKLKKCSFLSNTIDYLDHDIRLRRLKVALQTTDAIEALKPSKNITGVRSLLCLCIVFRRFVSIFPHISEHLNRKLQKIQPEKFGELAAVEAAGVKELQNCLTSPAVLALLYAEGHFMLDTDACNVRAGCMLMQEQPDYTTEPGGCWSRCQTKPELACDAGQREYLR